jgi:hypothetical protein
LLPALACGFFEVHHVIVFFAILVFFAEKNPSKQFSLIS